MSFEYEFKRANENEKKLCYILESNGWTNVTLKSDGYISDITVEKYQDLKDADLHFDFNGTTYSGELKSDYMSVQTGNVAIEYRYDSEPSGIASTKAYYWFTKLGDEYFAVKVTTLKNWLKKNLHRLRDVQAGDKGKSQLILVPKQEFLTIAKQVKYENDR